MYTLLSRSWQRFTCNIWFQMHWNISQIKIQVQRGARLDRNKSQTEIYGLCRTRHLGDRWSKFWSPSRKNGRKCDWASANFTPCRILPVSISFFATGAVCQKGTLSPPVTWSRLWFLRSDLYNVPGYLELIDNSFFPFIKNKTTNSPQYECVVIEKQFIVPFIMKTLYHNLFRIWIM